MSLSRRYAPINLLLSVSLFAIHQPGTHSALAIEAAVQDGAFVVEGASYFHDSKLAVDTTAEGDWKRRNLYLGPQVRFCVSHAV